MRHPRSTVGALAMAAALLTSCGGGDDGAATSPGGDPVPASGASPEGSWRLVEGEGPDGPVPLAEDAPITLTVEGGELSGTAACNSYGGTVDLGDGRFRPREVFQTEMACDPPETMESEAAYLEAFREVASHERHGDRLELTGDGVHLVYRAENEA